MLDMLIQGYRIFFLFLYEHLGFALAILLTSMISTFLMKPIAKFIMKYVKREQSYQRVLQPQIDEINATDLSGSEKHLALQRLYMRYGYSPILAMRKVLPLFVQLPFLMITYWMLEGCAELEGIKFLCFSDLGAADALLPFGINLLPFLMTGINVLAIFATPTFTKKDQIQALVVASLFLILLYPASSALMIYWTLNNFFTCVKTLLEENYSGGKLLWNRLRFVFAPSTIRTAIQRVFGVSPETFAYIAFVCFILAIHGYVVLMGKYHGKYFSGKIAMLSMNFYLTLAAVLSAFLWSRLKWAFLGLASVIILLQMGLVLDKLFIHSPYFGNQFTFAFVMIFDWAFCLLALLLLGMNIFTRLKWQVECAWREMFTYLFFFIALAVHYLSANTLLGFSVSSFFMLPFYLIACYLGLCVLGYLLFGKRLSFQVVSRTVFIFCAVFFMMPLFARGEGLLSIKMNIWLYYALSCGVLLIASIQAIKRYLNVFLTLVSVVLIFNGIVKVCSKQSEAPNITQEKKDGEVESYSHLDGLKIKNPYNVYVLIYDGWANPLFLDAYQIYNPLSDLQARGFTPYPRAYAPYQHTTASMSRFFDIFNDTGLSEKDIMAGRAKCLRFLRANGYKMHYVSEEMILQDVDLPLEGDFYFPSAITRIEDVLFKDIRNGFFEQTAHFGSFSEDDRAEAKQAILAKKDATPKFLYAHVGPGHTVGNGNFRQAEEAELYQYVRRLERAKKEMMKDLDSIAEWDNSIVVIASDHGAYLRRDLNKSDARNILNNNGILLAIKWPKGYAPTMDVSYSRNVMLEIMICLTGNKQLARFKHHGVFEDTYGVKDVDTLLLDEIFLRGPNKGKNIFDVVGDELGARDK